MTKIRKRGMAAQAQLSCWIGQATMDRLTAFVEANHSKQRIVVAAAIEEYVAAHAQAEAEPAIVAEPQPEAAHGGE